MRPCPRCGVSVLQATVLKPEGGGHFVTLDAQPAEGGEYATWSHRDGLNWIWRAQHRADGGVLGAPLRRVHDCKPAGQQLELGGAA